MKKYTVNFYLTAEFEDIEAKSEEEAIRVAMDKLLFKPWEHLDIHEDKIESWEEEPPCPK